MRPAKIATGAGLALVGPVPAMVCLAIFGPRHVARSPDRLADAAYILHFRGFEVIAGRT